MKRREIKNLKLNKSLISTLKSDNVKGGFRTIVNCSDGTFSKHLFHTCETCL